MKKILITMFSVMLSLTLMAQETVASSNEKSATEKENFLPEAGDISVGFTIDPIATFVGNMFNGSTENSLEPLHGEGLVNPCVSIMMKYMTSDNVAIKANVGFIIRTNMDNEYVVDDKAILLDPLSRSKVIDSENSSNFGGSISLGAEYRVGKRKVQGIFGGGVLYAFQTSNTTYTYGNGITELNQVPTSAFDTYTSYSTAIPNAREIRNYAADGFHTVGLYGSVGVEWFVAPKVSLGADVNLCLLYNIKSNQYCEYEGFNVFTSEVEKCTELVSPADHSFEFSTRNIGANLFINFYF